MAGVADGTYVSRVVASAAAPGTAWVTFDAHRDGDFAPYVFQTQDYGATWTARTQGLPSGSVNSLVEHPDNPAVLFLGTEHHLFVTTDEARTWALMPNLPTTHYDDLAIHPREKDLVMGTHGRGIWILDDTSPIAEWSAQVAAADVHVFPVRRGTLFHYWKDTSYRADGEFAGQNPADGVAVTYRLGQGRGNARMTVTGPDGRVVREMAVPGGEGVHRVNWDLRHGLPDAGPAWSSSLDPRLARSVEPRGPFVSPGQFQVTVEAGGASHTQTVEVRGDPLMPVTLAQYQERERFLLDVLDLEVRIDAALERISDRPDQAEARTQLEDARQAVSRVFRAMNGNGVRQGSLYPPTATHRQVVDEAEGTLARIESALAADGPDPQ